MEPIANGQWALGGRRKAVGCWPQVKLKESAFVLDEAYTSGNAKSRRRAASFHIIP